MVAKCMTASLTLSMYLLADRSSLLRGEKEEGSRSVVEVELPSKDFDGSQSHEPAQTLPHPLVFVKAFPPLAAEDLLMGALGNFGRGNEPLVFITELVAFFEVVGPTRPSVKRLRTAWRSCRTGRPYSSRR